MGGMADPPPPTDSRGRLGPSAVFAGWGLIVIGALIVLLCGGCTLGLWGGAREFITDVQSITANPWGSMTALFVASLLIGGLPTLGGVALIWAGWRTLRPRRGRARA